MGMGTGWAGRRPPARRGGPGEPGGSPGECGLRLQVRRGGRPRGAERTARAMGNYPWGFPGWARAEAGERAQTHFHGTKSGTESIRNHKGRRKWDFKLPVWLKSCVWGVRTEKTLIQQNELKAQHVLKTGLLLSLSRCWGWKIHVKISLWSTESNKENFAANNCTLQKTHGVPV